MKVSTFIISVLAAMLGGIFVGFLLSPIKYGLNISNNKISIGSHNGNGNAPSVSIKKQIKK